jgi:phage FluMu protein Com
VAFALETARSKGGSHYDVRCTRCRTVNKVPFKQLEKELPPRETPASSEA